MFTIYTVKRLNLTTIVLVSTFKLANEKGAKTTKTSTPHANKVFVCAK